MTGNDNTRLHFNFELVLRFMIMVCLFPFGEELARGAALQRLTPEFDDNNKPEPIGGLEALKHDVAYYRSEIVPRFTHTPLNQEEVSALIECVEIGLDSCMKRIAGTHPLGLELEGKYIASVIQDCEDAIDDLQNAFEVSDTEPLEQVRDKLQTWLDEMDRQHVPHPSYPEGPV